MKKIILSVVIVTMSSIEAGCLAGNLLPEKHYVEITGMSNPKEWDPVRGINNTNPKSFVYKSIPNTRPYYCSGDPNPLDKTGIYHIKYIVGLFSRCVMEPFDYVPEELVIEYAFWKTDAEIKAAGLDYKVVYNKNGDKDAVAVNYNANVLMPKRDADIALIPPNQWHRIVLHPKSDYATKYNYAPSLDKGWHKANNDKIIQYRIMINKDGSNKVYPIYDWKNASDGHWIP